MLGRGSPSSCPPQQGKAVGFDQLRGLYLHLSEERQQWGWAQVHLCQSDREAAPPHPAWLTAQPDWIELSIDFSSKMKVRAPELSHRMGEDGRKRRITLKPQSLMCYACFQVHPVFVLRKRSWFKSQTFLHLHETEFLYIIFHSYHGEHQYENVSLWTSNSSNQFKY